MSGVLNTLLEMGFPEGKAKIALSKTSGTDVQEAMDWLLSHEDDLESESETQVEKIPDTEVKKMEESSDTTNDESAETSEKVNDSEVEAKSLKCDDCGRLFKSHLEVEFHAAKSGHSNFSESTEEKKPLTEEEKRAQMAKVEEMIRQKRAEREEKEKKEALEREKNRIRSGKEMLEAKKKVEELEMLKIIEQRKREKQEEKLARQRVREQIEEDKQARKAKFGNQTENLPSIQPTIPAQTAPSVNKPATTKDYSEAKLQIRLTNGSALMQTFGAKEPLSAVRLYVEINRTDNPGPFSLMTTFPRKLFGPEDYDKPLDMLGLTPSAVLIVSRT